MQVGELALFRRGTTQVPVKIIRERRDFYKGIVELSAEVTEDHPEVNLRSGDVVRASTNWFTERQGTSEDAS